MAGKANYNGKRYTTPQSLNAAVKSICDIMRRSNCAGAMQYVPELTWILFLRILDEREQHEAEVATAIGVEFSPSLEPPYRWRDWAAPNGSKRRKLEASVSGAFYNFVNNDLIPYLKSLKDRPNATPRQKIISEIFSSINQTRIDTERNLLDVLDKVNEISVETVDPTHVFTLSQVYEGLLLKMGEKNNDGGQFFTPREIIRVIVRVIDPKIGETVYDPCCGTGGFLAQAYEHMAGSNHEKITSPGQLETLKRHTFYGREKDNTVYPIALANLVLHGIDEPHIWHGNTLTGIKSYDGLFQDAPELFDVVLTNPPFGGKEGQDAQSRFAYKTSATQVLFLQHVIDSLKPGGRCGIVLDEGVLFRTNETAFVQTKRKLLDECDVWCIVSLPPGAFVNAGAGVKTNLIFFTKGRPTERIWYYDLSDIKVGKKTPLTLAHFEEFFRLLPTRADSERSWTVDLRARQYHASNKAEQLRRQARIKEQELAEWKNRPSDDETATAEVEQQIADIMKDIRELKAKAEDIENAVYDLKAVNPHRKNDEDVQTPEELIEFIRSKGREIEEALATLTAWESNRTTIKPLTCIATRWNR